jgi:hypothetical protein
LFLDQPLAFVEALGEICAELAAKA